MQQTSDQIETPSGKDAAYENFPVGSWLLPAKLRPHVAVFYAFARTIDDIADAPDMEADVKIARLEGFERAISGSNRDAPEYQAGHRMRKCLQATGVTERHCLDLISAFKQDVVKSRCENWSELINYCQRSAAPVGRFLLDLHGGADDGYASSDALCNALQVLNHLQDAKADYLELDRVYLPADWMDEAGASVEDLNRNRVSPELTRVFARMLDATDALLGAAGSLPGALASTRLAMESGAILSIAELLSRKLRANDPLASRIRLSKFQYLRCCAAGAGKAVVGWRQSKAGSEKAPE
jgi:squalene synthase HpnC